MYLRFPLTMRLLKNREVLFKMIGANQLLTAFSIKISNCQTKASPCHYFLNLLIDSLSIAIANFFIAPSSFLYSCSISFSNANIIRKGLSLTINKPPKISRKLSHKVFFDFAKIHLSLQNITLNQKRKFASQKTIVFPKFIPYPTICTISPHPNPIKSIFSPFFSPFPVINSIIILITYFASKAITHRFLYVVKFKFAVRALFGYNLQSKMSGSTILGIVGRWNVLYGGFPRLLVFESNASQLTAKMHDFADGMAIGAATIASNLKVEPLHGGVYFRFEQSGTISEGVIDREGKELRGLATVNQQKHQLQGFKDEE